MKREAALCIRCDFSLSVGGIAVVLQALAKCLEPNQHLQSNSRLKVTIVILQQVGSRQLFCGKRKARSVIMLSKVVADQVKGTPNGEVEELILDNWKCAELSVSDKALLESFPNIQFLSMNSCGLRSLHNFPLLPKLIKLELNDNKIAGGLEKLVGMKDLMQITLAGNQLRTLEDIRPLVISTQTQLTSLVAIDLYHCPVAAVPQYRETLFASLPVLEILDHTNKKGEDASLSDDQDQEDEEVSDEEEQVADGFIDDEEEENSEEASEDESSPQKRPKT